MNYKILCPCIWWFTVTITCWPLLQNREIRENNNEKINQNRDMVNMCNKKKIVTIFVILLYINV